MSGRIVIDPPGSLDERLSAQGSMRDLRQCSFLTLDAGIPLAQVSPQDLLWGTAREQLRCRRWIVALAFPPLSLVRKAGVPQRMSPPAMRFSVVYVTGNTRKKGMAICLP